LRLEFAIYENAQLKAENAELRVKYEEIVVQCERLISENKQLRVYKEHLTEEIDRMVTLCELRLQDIQEIFSDTPVAIDDMTSNSSFTPTTAKQGCRYTTGH
jgi:predicted nuclease with TOPRIM domain